MPSSAPRSPAATSASTTRPARPAILPTPVVAVLGVIDDVAAVRRRPGRAGERVFLLGETREELSGSEWAHVVHGHLGGLPPAVDLVAERSLASLLQEAVGLVTSAHDLSEGGLAQALVEATLRHGVGVSVAVGDDPFVALFSESTARVLVTVADGDAERLVELAAPRRPADPARRDRGDVLAVDGQFDVRLDELRAAWTATLPAALA